MGKPDDAKPVDAKPAEEAKVEETAAPAKAPEAPKKAEAEKPKKDKYVAPTVEVSPKGVAVYAPGRHPKARQLADKAAAEAGQ